MKILLLKVDIEDQLKRRRNYSMQLQQQQQRAASTNHQPVTDAAAD